MNEADVAWLTFAGTALVALGAMVGAWFRSRANLRAAQEAADVARTGSKPDTINALGERLDEAFERIDAQDVTIETQRREIEGLRGEVQTLRRQSDDDEEVRHKLKGGVIHLVTVIRQLMAAVLEHFTEDQIRSLPEPSRRHVRDGEDFDAYMELARARRDK